MPSDALVLTVVAASAGASASIDVRTHRVPNWLTLGTATLGLALAAADLSGVSVGGALGGFALGLLLMLPGHLMGKTGAGDVKLFAALGTLLGPTPTALAFVYTAIAGGVLALLVAICRGRFGETLEGAATLVRTGGANVAELEESSADNRFAYAPAIAAGVLAAALGL